MTTKKRITEPATDGTEEVPAPKPSRPAAKSVHRQPNPVAAAVEALLKALSVDPKTTRILTVDLKQNAVRAMLNNNSAITTKYEVVP